MKEITVTVTLKQTEEKDGININTLITTSDNDEYSFYEIVGLLETAKNNILNFHNGASPKKDVTDNTLTQ